MAQSPRVYLLHFLLPLGTARFGDTHLPLASSSRLRGAPDEALSAQICRIAPVFSSLLRGGSCPGCACGGWKEGWERRGTTKRCTTRWRRASPRGKTTTKKRYLFLRNVICSRYISSGHHNIIYIYKTLKKVMLLHIQRTLSIVSRFREGKKQTPKTILCIFHLVSGEQAFQFYGRDIETLKRTYQK